MDIEKVKELCDDGELLCGDCPLEEHCPMEDEAERAKEEEERRAKLLRNEETNDLKHRAKVWASKIQKMECPQEFFGHKLTEEECVAYYKALGFLAAYGSLQEKIPIRHDVIFDERYRQIKGVDPEGIRHDICDKTWAISMSIHFNRKVFGRLDDHLFPKRPVTNSNGGFAIYHTEWCWKLMESGFDLRGRHNLKAIESSIPEEYLPSFREGTQVQ